MTPATPILKIGGHLQCDQGGSAEFAGDQYLVVGILAVQIG
jgi:hypothetical protein